MGRLGHCQLGPSGAVWGRLGLSAGAVWGDLGRSGTIWSRLGLSGAVWGRLGPPGPLGFHVAHFVRTQKVLGLLLNIH